VTILPRPLLALLLALALAAPAAAHHRQTPAILQFTTSGDVPLPRVPTPGRHKIALAVPDGSSTEVVVIQPFLTPGTQQPVPQSSGAENPAISLSGNGIAFDTDADPLETGEPGSQVVLSFAKNLLSVSSDGTGTSANPTVDTVGLRVAFESTGDLAGTGNPGARQIFLRQPDGSITQISGGVGTSRNPYISAKGGLLAYESTSNPVGGDDTGISQIWLANVYGTRTPAPITSGAGPSRNPAISDDARIVAFESTADLAGTGADTGVPQIFTYDSKSKTYAQVTFDAGGCTLPAVQKVKRDWRIAFVCGGQGYFFMLRADQRFHVQTNGGLVQRVIPQLGIHFVTISTTGDLLGSGTTPNKQVYMINLYKRPPESVATGPAVWFPFQGIGPL